MIAPGVLAVLHVLEQRPGMHRLTVEKMVRQTVSAPDAVRAVRWCIDAGLVGEFLYFDGRCPLRLTMEGREFLSASRAGSIR